MLQSDNGSEYMDKSFGSFLKEHKIHHQTSCTCTPEQNSFGKKKEYANNGGSSSLFVWHEYALILLEKVVKSTAYLINHIPSRVIGFQTP